MKQATVISALDLENVHIDSDCACEDSGNSTFSVSDDNDCGFGDELVSGLDCDC